MSTTMKKIHLLLRTTLLLVAVPWLAACSSDELDPLTGHGNTISLTTSLDGMRGVNVLQTTQLNSGVKVGIFGIAGGSALTNGDNSPYSVSGSALSADGTEISTCGWETLPCQIISSAHTSALLSEDQWTEQTTNPHSALIWTEFEVSSLDSVLFHAQAGSIHLCFATIRPQSDTPFNLEVLLILLDGSVCTVCSFCITLYLICSCLEEQDKLTRPIEDLKNYQKMDIFLFGRQQYVYVLVSFSLWKKKLLWDR